MIPPAASAESARAAFAASPRTTDPAADPGVFRSVLGRAVAGAGGGGDEQSRARGAAEELVSIALIQPILAELRANNDAAPPFAPGPYEKQFGSLMDAELSRRLVKAQNFPLVDRLARDLLRVSQTTEGQSDEPTETDHQADQRANTERP